MSPAAVIGALSLAIWIYLVTARGLFWLGRERDDRDEPVAEPARWPAVIAVVPARDEADVIARSVGSLLAQDYPGPFRIVLVDDHSADGTAEAARTLAGAEGRLEILPSAPRPPGWTGKLWAVAQGVERAGEGAPYLLLTDADIGHAPENLRRLVARAEAGDLALTSLMVRLHCRTLPERLLIPAFVYFFQMLYPFAWVNRRGGVAAAAGGCMLVRRETLAAAGGIAAIRGEIIDDCALGRRLKQQGPIWLGLGTRAESLRPYRRFGEIGRMVSRSAYAQLGYSPVMLVGCLIGMGLTYLAPPLLAVFGHGFARIAGGAAWLLMTVSFVPILRLYRLTPLWAPLLPVIGLIYSLFTLDSAVQVWRGRGGMWKGRAQAMTS